MAWSLYQTELRLQRLRHFHSKSFTGYMRAKSLITSIGLEAIQKPMPKMLHGAMQFVSMLLLNAPGWNVFPEIRLKLHPHAEPVPAWVITAEHPEPTWIYPDRALQADDTEFPLQVLFTELDKKTDGISLADEDLA